MTHKPPTKLLSPKACVKIGQWNVRTMFETGKCAQVIKEMQRYGISILGVSEMRWNSCGKLRVATGETVLYSGMDEGENHERGVGFILSKEAAQCLLEWEPVSERIIRARFNSRWQKVTILQCYAPTNEATEEVKDDFYDQLQMVLEQVPCRDVKIVMGDMNAKMGMDNTGREEVMGKHGARAEMNENGERWADFCQANELVIGGTLFPHKECHKRTWRSPDGGIVNQIDHLAFSKRWRSSLQDVRAMRGADVGSDHHLLMAKVRLRIAKVRKGDSGRVRFEVSKLKDLEVRNAFKLALHNRFEGLQQLMEEEELSVDDEWRQIEQGYVETCEQVLGRAKANRKEWISKETWELIEQRKVAKNTINMARTRNQKREASKRYQELNREVKRRCRRDKRAYVEAEAERAEEAGKRGDARTLYEITRKLSGRIQNTCKPVRNEAGVLLRTAEEEMHRWREHFQTVLNHEEPINPPEVEPNDELNIRTGHVTRIEIKNAIKKLKNGKAAGCDNIPPEAIKAGGDTSEEVLLGLCNRLWNEEKIPEEWRKGLLIKLPKKGDLSYCKNWRGIMLLNMASKVFCRVILERIKIALDEKLREEQAGFRAGRSCTDQIATLRIIIEQSIEWQSSLYINFIDFEKAFDSISRDVLWRLLRHYGLPDKIVTIIRVLYEGFSAQVVHNGQKTQPLDMRTGVRQGCLLSPLLFLVALDWVTRTAFDRKRGIQWTFTTSLEDLDFADDLALLSHRIQDMRDKTRALEVQSAKVGLKINATKTKLMRIGTKRGDVVSVAGKRVEEVDEFTYLGSIVSKKGGTDEDIQARIGKARQAFAMLRPIWRSTALTTKTKLRVFGTNVKAVLLYGSETWRLTKGLEQKLQVFINKSLRNILRIWWPRKISNKDLWSQTGQRPIEEEIRQRAWGWIGHTLRKPDGHVVKRALEWNPQGKRKRGRPQNSWRRTRMAELAAKHVTWNEAKGTAQNRVRWRALVEDLCST